MTTKQQLWEVVNLRQVSLSRAVVSSTLRPEALPEQPPQLVLDIDARGADLPELSMVEVIATVKITGRGPDAAEAPVFLVEADYRLLYDRPADFEVGDDEVNLFARQNGMFNVWPYWREFTHSIYTRMDLPFPPLPVYRVNGGVHGVPTASETEAPAPSKVRRKAARGRG